MLSAVCDIDTKLDGLCTFFDLDLKGVFFARFQAERRRIDCHLTPTEGNSLLSVETNYSLSAEFVPTVVIVFQPY